MRSRVYITSGVRPSVRLSVCGPICPIDRQPRRAGLLLGAGVCNIYRSIVAAPCSRRSAANVGSVTLTADGGGSTQTHFDVVNFCLSVLYFTASFYSLSHRIYVMKQSWVIRLNAYLQTRPPTIHDSPDFYGYFYF